ncbi:MAG: hypothetical protein KKI02_10775 [Planctomycetes bacterium]|nr:hypothetical protein [Planctomycetota bacterium]
MSPPPDGATQILLKIPDREAFIDDTLSLLRRRDFTPERVDRDAGLVVTQPSTGQQWFEFWRHDSIGGYQLLESSIHTVRRIVTVHVDPVEADSPGDEFRVSVQVGKQRHSAPERQVTTASGALAIYSEHLPTTEGLAASRAEGEHWVPLGRDVQLELYLLDKITGATPGVTLLDGRREPAPAQSKQGQEPS